LLRAWGVIALWVLAYAVLKVVQPDGMDIDSAEQVYFAQSWQMGYGLRQPPLYTWLLLALKPVGASWELTLECARYLVLLTWLGGVQGLARALGANPATQARVLLAHLGLMLAMWRVHDSLTHTVLAGAITLWGSVAVAKALAAPRWWPAVGLLAAAACLAKLNAVLWCGSSLLAALGVLAWQGRSLGLGVWPLWRAHLGGLLLALGLCLLCLAPYAQWWWAQRDGPLSLAHQIVVSDGHVAWWRPGVDVVLGSVEYLLLVPLWLGLLAWFKGRRAAASPAPSLAMRWVGWQVLCGLVLLVVLVSAMKGSHFTPRWLWPVVPGFTVWLCVWALGRAAVLPAVWARRFDMLIWGGVALALVLALVRWWEPTRTAQHCRNCWTDRPAEAMSVALHGRFGAGPLRLVTGDDHLAGILADARPQDRTWTAVSPDLPPPLGFAAAQAPCVAVWLDMDQPQAAPAELQAMLAQGPVGEVWRQQWPLARAPQRTQWLQAVMMRDEVCARAPR
jgi:hypothetical protein